MLDPALVRDHMDVVRTGLQNRGLKIEAERCRSLATLETRRRSAAAAGRGSQTGAERGGRGGCACEARRARPLGDLRGEQDARAAHPSARGRGRRGRGAAFGAPDDAPESASRERADWHVRRGQPGSSSARRAPVFAFEPKPHWDLGPALGIHRFRACHANVRARDSRCCSARARGSRAR